MPSVVDPASRRNSAEKSELIFQDIFLQDFSIFSNSVSFDKNMRFGRVFYCEVELNLKEERTQQCLIRIR